MSVHWRKPKGLGLRCQGTLCQVLDVVSDQVVNPAEMEPQKRWKHPLIAVDYPSPLLILKSKNKYFCQI